MLRLRQQMRHDIMLEMTIDDCLVVLDALKRLLEQHLAFELQIDAHATSLRIRFPQLITLHALLGDSDCVRKEDGKLVMELQRETVDELVGRFADATSAGRFSPSELVMLDNHRGETIRFYAIIEKPHI